MKLKLNDHQIEKIRQAYERGYSKRVLMSSYNLTWTEINKILDLWR